MVDLPSVATTRPPGRRADSATIEPTRAKKYETTAYDSCLARWFWLRPALDNGRDILDDLEAPRREPPRGSHVRPLPPAPRTGARGPGVRARTRPCPSPGRRARGQAALGRGAR